MVLISNCDKLKVNYVTAASRLAPSSV